MLLNLFGNIFSKAKTPEVVQKPEPQAEKIPPAAPLKPQPAHDEEIDAPEVFTAEQQLTMCQDKNPTIRERVAGYKDITDSAQGILVADKADSVRMILAGNEKLLESHQETLSHDKHFKVRCWLAVNRSISSTIQGRLSRDERVIRQLLACNDALLPEHQETLSKDPDKEIRAFIAEKNPAKEPAKAAKKEEPEMVMSL